MRRVLTEAVPCNDVERLVERSKQRDGRCKHCRLRVRRELQIFFGSVEAKCGQGFTERGVGFVEDRARRVGGVVRFAAHADLLAALAWKNERDLAHREAA